MMTVDPPVVHPSDGEIALIHGMAEDGYNPGKKQKTLLNPEINGAAFNRKIPLATFCLFPEASCHFFPSLNRTNEWRKWGNLQ